MAKLGFILLVLLFGALTFAAGLLAPDSLREDAASILARLRAPPPSAAKAAATEATKPAKTEPAPIPYEALLIPTPLPSKGKYALQLALLTDPDAAAALAKRAAQFNYATKELPVVDRNGARWIAVAAGAYPSPDDARTARASLAQRLALTRPLPIILLPAKKKKK